MAFYVLHFLNSTKKLSDERSFFYHNDVIVKRMADIYRKKLKVIDTFSFDEFISLAAHDEEAVAFFVKTKICLLYTSRQASLEIWKSFILRLIKKV